MLPQLSVGSDHMPESRDGVRAFHQGGDRQQMATVATRARNQEPEVANTINVAADMTATGPVLFVVCSANT